MGMSIFTLALFSMDIEHMSNYKVNDFVKKFAFTCIEGHPTRWYTEDTGLAELLFTLHPVVILISSTLCLIVLSSIAFRYDRLAKTKKEKKIEKEMKRLEAENRRKNKLS